MYNFEVVQLLVCMNIRFEWNRNIPKKLKNSFKENQQHHKSRVILHICILAICVAYNSP